ncbi:hypothetical protein ACMZ89_02305 [Gardnerella vaginalis]|uniref:hypothetical protein n=1 Tax=Gardnerella TaxID=2701 RepID=UPI0039F0992D
MLKIKRKLLPNSWETYVTHWLEYLEASGYTEDTIRCRYYKISRLARLLNQPPEDITGQQLVELLHTKTGNEKRAKVILQQYARFTHT